MNKKKVVFRAIFYGMIAAVIYFCIAFFSNLNHPLDLRLKVSTWHGFFCFAMTFCSTSLMEMFFNFPKKMVYKYLSAIVGAGLIGLSLTITINILLKTPELFKTVFYTSLTAVPYYLLFPLQLFFEEITKRAQDLSYRRDPIERSLDVTMFSTPYNMSDLKLVFKHNIVSPREDFREYSKNLEEDFTLSTNFTPKMKLGFLGDLMPMYKKELLFSDEVRSFFSDVDYLVANFEGTLKNDKKVFLAQAHNEKILDNLTALFNPQKIILSVANNHAADFGYENFLRTCQTLRAKGFLVIGGKDESGITVENSIHIASATEWTNQPHGYLSFLEDHKSFIDSSAKCNILFPHWCHEMEKYPRPRCIDRAKEMLKDWDAIVGHHSHIPGVVTSYKIGPTHKLVAYSLGNSATGLFRPRYRLGQALKVEIGPTLDGMKWVIGKCQYKYTKLEKNGVNKLMLRC